MQLDILTPDKVLYSGEVTGVKVPGSMGSFEILNNHAPIVSTLDAGTIRINCADGEQLIPIKGGVVEMIDNKITILA